jgi:alpha-glucosidase
MSGYGLTHSDAGGYTTIMHMTRSKELLLRWEEMNAFSPLFRFHEGNQPSRNVQFDADEELLEQLSRMSRIHAGLKNYLKALVKDNAEQALPVMRPLFYHYDGPWAYSLQSEYLLGSEILVAPVMTEGARSRSVWLPEDNWVHLFTGQDYLSGTYDIEAPIGRPPVFVRRNSPWFKELMELGKI